MRVLIIKTSSMGDVIHTLPALTDAGSAISNIQFDWVVEENFAEIPAWHPRVNQVIPVALRRWRKQLFSRQTHLEFKQFRDHFNASYDLIIDAQGLLKSAWLVWLAKGLRCGLDWNSAREPLASWFYQRKLAAGKIKEVHAVTRMRQLFSQALNYELPQSVANYGIDRFPSLRGAERRGNPDLTTGLPRRSAPRNGGTPSAGTPDDYVVFLHGTTWKTKHWPESYWIELAKILSQQQIAIKIPWGNQAELERAQRIAAVAPQCIEVLPRMKLLEIAPILAAAKAIVAVDTGLGHLAAALDVPTISLYGPTNSILTGALGGSQIHLSAQFACSPCLSSECKYRQPTQLYSVEPPCFSTLMPDKVANQLQSLILSN